MLDLYYDDTNDYNKTGNIGICCEIAHSYYKDMASRMRYNQQFAEINRKYAKYNFVMTGSI